MHRCHGLSLLVLLLFAPAGHAAPLSPGMASATGHGRVLKVQNTDVGADGAARAVRRATGGRVLSVTRVNTDGGAAWRVKVLLEGGRVRIVLVDAASGALR